MCYDTTVVLCNLQRNAHHATDTIYQYHHPIMNISLTNTTKTKIVATLGPSSSNATTLRTMLEAGMSVARLNMSHGDQESHEALIKTARSAAKKHGRPLALLQDLSGPKIRIGDFSTEEVELHEEAPFTLTTTACTGDDTRVWVNYAKLPQEVEPGMDIFLNDGKLMLRVDAVEGTDIQTTVIHGGTIRGRRGVNVPDGNLSIPSLTAKDKRDLVFGLAQKFDFITLSFVRSAADVTKLKKLIGDHPAMVIAKIETRQAIEHLDEIIDVADGIMVARGDLAIEVPPERVPLLQKRIISAANRAGKPVITATQMLDSMRTSPVPTRAEVNDVANAILDGTDAVMLSDESAIGHDPARAVRTMSRIANATENDAHFMERRAAWDFTPQSVCDAVSRSIAKSAASTGAKAIVAFSESGYTGRMVARYRPQLPILVLTPNKETFARSLITYACEPVLVHRVLHLTDARRIARNVLLDKGFASEGDVFVLGAGIPFGKPGATNMMLVERV